MRYDLWLFNLINGQAGRLAWLDNIGRFFAIYGLLVVMLLVAAVLWWPRIEAGRRRRYVGALILSVAICFLCGLLEWLLAAYVLHHEVRMRPFNSQWATLLITAESHFAFPAWPVVIAGIFIVPTYRISRHIGLTICGISLLLAISLVFAGANYPVDVITGWLLGLVIGLTSATIARQSNAEWARVQGAGCRAPETNSNDAVPVPRGASWRNVALAWVLVAIWVGIIAVSIRPADKFDEESGAEVPGICHVSVPAPAAVLSGLQPAFVPDKVECEAATNGHLLVADVSIIEPDQHVPLPRVEDDARKAVNATFTRWPQLDLLTAIISTTYRKSHTGKTGTYMLYTATVSRKDWPPDGFPPGHKLPGKKYFHHHFFEPRASAHG